MRSLAVARFAVLTATLSPYAAAFGQALTIADVVNGKFPTSMAPADLPDTYRAARIVNSGPVPDPLTNMAPLLFMSYSPSGNGVNTGLLPMINESWTDGTMVNVNGQAFLVTYKLNLSMTDFLMRSNQAAVDAGVAGVTPPQLPPQGDRNLKLTLVKVDGIQSITPDPELTKEKLLTLLGQGVGRTVGDQSSEAAMRTQTLSNIKQVSLGMMLYASDYDDVYPWPQGMQATKFVTAPYLKNENLWKTLNPNGGEIRFNMALGGVSMTSLEAPADTVMMYETKEWPNGQRCVSFADGHAMMVNRDRWRTLEKNLTTKFPKTVKKPLPLNYGLTVTK